MRTVETLFERCQITDLKERIQLFLSYVDDFTDKQFRQRPSVQSALEGKPWNDKPVTWDIVAKDLLSLYPRETYNASITTNTL